VEGQNSLSHQIRSWGCRQAWPRKSFRCFRHNRYRNLYRNRRLHFHIGWKESCTKARPWQRSYNHGMLS